MNTLESKSTYLPPTSGTCFGVSKLEGKGEGVIATQNLKPGEVIFQERALLKLKHFEVRTDTIQSALEGMTEAHRSLYYRLHNCYTAKEGYSGPDISELLGIWATNAFGTDDNEQVLMLGATSKINHSCKPNASRVWCTETDTWSIVASEYIRAGQEITHQYLDVRQVSSMRRIIALKKWGFLCECEACLQPPESLKESDERRSRLQRLSDSLAAHSFANEDQVKEALDLCAAEGLYSHLSIISCEYVRHCAKQGLHHKAAIWSEIAAKHLTYAVGEDHEEVRFFRRCAKETQLYREERLAGNVPWLEKLKSASYATLRASLL